MSTITARAAQFAASADWEQNVAVIRDAIETADADAVDVLVLPEGVLARFMDRRERIREFAQPLDGPFVTQVLEATRGRGSTVILGIHERPADDDLEEPAPEAAGGAADGQTLPRPYNTLLAVRDGELVEVYRKIHLYDAFRMQESENVRPADVLPPLISVGGFQVGLMTCYDVRFPEQARLLALAGADAIALPAAWVKGPLKEDHWRTLATARALDNTVYVIGSSECGPANIGRSLIVDPLGVPIAQVAEGPGHASAQLSRARIDEARDTLPVLRNYRFEVSTSPRRLQPLPAADPALTADPHR